MFSGTFDFTTLQNRDISDDLTKKNKGKMEKQREMIFLKCLCNATLLKCVARKSNERDNKNV